MRILIVVWGLLWSFPLAAIILGAILCVPMLLSLVFTGSVGFLVALLSVLLGVVLFAVIVISLVGIFKGWYFSWVWLSVTNFLAPFVIGVSLIGAAFQSPFPIGILFILGLGGMLKLSFVIRHYWNSDEIRSRYEVERYTAS